MSEEPIVISEHEPRLKTVRHCLSKLLDDPVHGRDLGHVEVKHPTATMLKNDEYVEDVECRGGDGAEVDGPAFIEMISKEGQPRL